MVKSWSKTLSTLALSSGESELAALAKGTAEGLGIQSILSDFGIRIEIQIHSDATAAIGIAGRQGLGRIRHVAVADLWVQQRLKAGDFKVFKVNGLDNISISPLLIQSSLSLGITSQFSSVNSLVEIRIAPP